MSTLSVTTTRPEDEINVDVEASDSFVSTPYIEDLTRQGAHLPAGRLFDPPEWPGRHRQDHARPSTSRRS